MIANDLGTIICDTPAEVAFVKSVFALDDSLSAEWSKRIKKLKSIYGVSCTVYVHSCTTFHPEMEICRNTLAPDVVLRHD